MSTIAVPQIAVADLDIRQNLSTICDRVAALDPDVELAVFPEYGVTGFVPDERAHDTALDRDGPEITRIQEVATRADVGIVVGFLERGSASNDANTDVSSAVDASADASSEVNANADASSQVARSRSKSSDKSPLYNALAYIAPDGTRTVYRKRHLWNREAEVVSPGEQLVTVETPVGTAGLVTCYDLNFVDDSAAFTERAVDALLVAGAWPAAHSENWRLLLRARALDGVRWVVGAGRTGQRDVPNADATNYAGQSMVVRPDGKILGSLGREERDLVADLDPAVLARQRREIPVYEDRR